MNKKGLSLVLTTALISGVSIFVSKKGIVVFNPYIFTFLKNVTVALFLTSLFLGGKNFLMLRNLKVKHWMLLVVIGIIGGGIAFLLFFKGLSLTTAAEGSFLQKTMFIYVAFLAAMFLKEKINKRFLFGGLLLFLGNLLMLKSLKLSFDYGDFLVLGATILWAVENVISKYALGELEGKVVAWGRMFFGSLTILAFLAATGQLASIANLNFEQIGWTLVTSVLLFGYVMSWYSGLKLVPVTVATSVLLLGAPITSVMSLVTAGKISGQELFSSLLILSGIASMIGASAFSKRIKESLNKYVRT